MRDYPEACCLVSLVYKDINKRLYLKQSGGWGPTPEIVSDLCMPTMAYMHAHTIALTSYTLYCFHHKISMDVDSEVLKETLVWFQQCGLEGRLVLTQQQGSKKYKPWLDSESPEFNMPSPN